MSDNIRRRVLDLSILVIGCSMVAYHIVSTQKFLVGPSEHQNIHLGFSLILLFLTWLRLAAGKKRVIEVVLLLASLAGVCYVGILDEELERRVLFNTTPDLIIGGILITVVVIACWRSFGAALPIVAIICVFYMAFGFYLPGPLHGPKYALYRVIASLSVGLTGGIYGMVLSVSANYIFLFMVFGALLQATGGTRFFFEIGKLFSRKLRGGAAMSAVIGSAVVGTITGSAAANVAITGAFTIPLMKKAGYTPAYAGATEAAASTGGQIMPPVMGAAAFGLVAFTGVSYVEVMAAAFIPAVLYFFSLGLHTQLAAMRLNVTNVLANEPIDRKQIALGAPLFFIPIAILMYLLVARYSPMYAACWSIVAMVIVAFVRRETRPSFGKLVNGFAEGAKLGAMICVASATIGLIITSLQETGLVTRLPTLVERWSGGNFLPALMITFFISLFLGCGMPTLAVYVTVAMVGAPVLIKMGLPMLQAHLFVLFSGVFSYLTPPVAVGALVASQMAGETYMKTALTGLRIAGIAYLLPFLIALVPAITLQQPDIFEAVVTVIAAFAAMISFGMVVESFWLKRISRAAMVLPLISFLSLVTFLLIKGWFAWSGVLFLVGIAIILLITAYQWWTLKTSRLHGVDDLYDQK